MHYRTALVSFFALHIQAISILGQASHPKSYQSLGKKRSAPCYDAAPDASLICGDHGKLTLVKPRRTGKTNATSLLNCKEKAVQQYPIYNSIGWNSDTSECFLYPRSMQGEGFEPGSSDQVFYDLDCFKCLNPCPTPEGTNLVGNSGFENSDSSLFPWSSDNTGYLATPGHNSQQSYGSVDGYISQKIPTCLSTTYLLSFDYKFVFQPSGIGDSQISIGIEDIDTRILPTVDQNNTWFTASTVFQTQSILDVDKYSFLGLGPSSNGKVFLDNIEIVPTSPKKKESAPNLISNPTFEDGTLNSWTSKSCTVVSPGHNSDFAAQCLATDQAGQFGNKYVLYQNVTTKPETTYFIGFDYKAKYNHPRGNSCYFLVEIGDTSLVTRETYSGVPYNRWQRYEVIYTSHQARSLLSISPGDEINGDGYYCRFFFDNVEIREGTY